MKRTFFILTTLIAIIFTSCSEEDSYQVQQDRRISSSSEIESVLTGSGTKSAYRVHITSSDTVLSDVNIEVELKYIHGDDQVVHTKVLNAKIPKGKSKQIVSVLVKGRPENRQVVTTKIISIEPTGTEDIEYLNWDINGNYYKPNTNK